MDARLRERRGILRVSASRHIDCSVRRRPFGSTPFTPHWQTRFAASALQMRPPSGWMRCTPQPYPPAAVLLVRSATLAHHARDAPSSLFRPRSPRPVLAHRAPFRPYPSTSGGKSLILKRVAENRAPYSRFFASRTFQKPPLIRKCSKSRHSFEASPLSSGDYRRKARPLRVCQEVCVSPISLYRYLSILGRPPRRTGAGCAPGTSRRDGSPRPTCDTAPAPSGTAASSPPPRWGTTPPHDLAETGVDRLRAFVVYMTRLTSSRRRRAATPGPGCAPHRDGARVARPPAEVPGRLGGGQRGARRRPRVWSGRTPRPLSAGRTSASCGPGGRCSAGGSPPGRPPQALPEPGHAVGADVEDVLDAAGLELVEHLHPAVGASSRPSTGPGRPCGRAGRRPAPRTRRRCARRGRPHGHVEAATNMKA